MRRIPPRYELKYLISRDTRDRVRDLLPATCALDPNCEAAREQRYVISSLYLDGPDLPFHRAKVDRAPRRLKLRVRHYPGTDPPAEERRFLEVKRRVGDVIIKRRTPLGPDEDWASIVRGEGPGAAGADDFASLVALYDARPVALVRYEREAWVSFVDEYARVTFDSALEYQAHEAWDLEEDPSDWRSADDPATFGSVRSELILELKFAERIPRWMESLAHRLELYRRGFSKYCTAVDHLYVRDRRVAVGERAPGR